LQISLTSGLTEDSWILTPAFAFFNLSWSVILVEDKPTL
jgi:hypothetical protein